MVRVNLAIKRFIKPQFLLELAYKVSAGRVGVKSCGHAVLADTPFTELKTFFDNSQNLPLSVYTHTHMYYKCYTCNYIVVIVGHVLNLNHMSKLHKMVVKFVATRWYCTFKANYNLSLFGQFVLLGMNLNYQML